MATATKRMGSLALALALVLAAAVLPQAEARRKKQRSDVGNAPIARNFLPPLATLNGPVEKPGQTLGPAAVGDDGSDQDIEALEFSADQSAKPELNLSDRPERLDNKVAVQDATQMQFLAKQQQALDKDDYNKLWASTVERNPVIQFALEKVTSPADLQPNISSKFYKNLASMAVQGLTVGSMMFLPGGGYQRMGAAALGQGVDNVLTGKNKEQPGAPLTDTEKIQLAQLLEELNSALLTDYHNYKNTLMLLSEIQQSVIEKNNTYSHAIKGGNEVAMMAAATAYYKSAKNQTELRQQAKLYRMKLERLAGNDAVSDLQLALFSTEDVIPEPSQAETKTPELPEGANLVKLEPAPAAPEDSGEAEPVAASALVETGTEPAQKPQPAASKQPDTVGPPEPVLEETQNIPQEIGPTLEELSENPRPVTADDFRRAADIQTHLPTVETATGRIGIADDGSPSPLPQPIDEAMPILRRAR